MYYTLFDNFILFRPLWPQCAQRHWRSEASDAGVKTPVCCNTRSFCHRLGAQPYHHCCLVLCTSFSHFEQKTFINVCWHEFLELPSQESMTKPNGEKGTAW